MSAPGTISVAGRSTRFSELQRLDEVESISPSQMIKRSGAKSVAPSVAGSRLSVLSGSQVSRPETITRVAVDEIEALLKQKLSGAGHHQLKTAWVNNDVDGKGLVNRDVFRIMLSKFLNREISARHIELLLQRIHCAHLTQLRYKDIYGPFKPNSANVGLPLWLDSAPSSKSETGDLVTGIHFTSKIIFYPEKPVNAGDNCTKN